MTPPRPEKKPKPWWGMGRNREEDSKEEKLPQKVKRWVEDFKDSIANEKREGGPSPKELLKAVQEKNKDKKRGILATLNPHQVTSRHLLRETKGGNSLLHYLSADDTILEKLPKELWADKVLEKANDEGVSGLHALCQLGKAKILPREFWTKEKLLRRTSGGKTVLAYIIEANSVRVIPTELLTREVLKEKSGLGNHIRLLAKHQSLHILPKNTLRVEDAFEEDLEGNLTIFWAGLNGQLESFPKETYSESSISKHHKEFVGVLVDACNGQNIDKIPRQLLKKELFEEYEPASGGTPLHAATRSNEIDLLPKEFFTEENILSLDDDGLNLITILTKERLLENLNKSAIDKLRLLFSKLEDKTLEKISRLYNDLKPLVEQEILKRKIREAAKENEYQL
jgi:hypothetical protein